MDTKKTMVRGELVLPVIIVMNSFGVVLMLYSGTGISAISSMTYALSEVLPVFSLGTWTYIFQSALVLSLMILRKRFVLQYLLSFGVGFAFGLMMDVHKEWMQVLPLAAPFRVFYFAASYLIICMGVALSNRCKMPIIPTDLFPKELSDITGTAFSRIKVSFDLICVVITAVLTLVCLGGISGLGIGTLLSALTMGKVIGRMDGWMDRHVEFVTYQMRRHGRRRLRVTVHSALRSAARHPSSKIAAVGIQHLA